MDPSDLFLIVVRASVLYFLLLFVVRLMGKREIGSTSAFDLFVSHRWKNSGQFKRKR